MFFLVSLCFLFMVLFVALNCEMGGFFSWNKCQEIV